MTQPGRGRALPPQPRLARVAADSNSTDSSFAFGFTPAAGQYDPPEMEQRLRSGRAILSRVRGETRGITEGERRLELRYFRRRRGGPVEVAVLGAVAASSSQSASPDEVARRAAARFAKDLGVLLNDLAPGLDWRPLRTETDLRHALDPFPVRRLAVLRFWRGDPWEPVLPGPVAAESIVRTAERVSEPFLLSISLRVAGAATNTRTGRVASVWRHGVAVEPLDSVSDPSEADASSPWQFLPRIVLASGEEWPDPIASAVAADVEWHGRVADGGAIVGERPVIAAWDPVPNVSQLHEQAERALASLDVDWPDRGEQPAHPNTTVGLRGASHLFALPVRQPSRDGQVNWPRSVLEAPPRIPSAGWVIGRTVGDSRQRVALSEADRRHGTLLVGAKGGGKSTAQERQIVSDFEAASEPVVVVMEPHNSLSDRVLGLLPAHRTDGLIVFDPADPSGRVVAWNPFVAQSPVEKSMIVSSTIGLMYELFDPHHEGIVGPRFEHAVRNAMFLVLGTPGATIADVMEVLVDPGAFRKFIRKETDAAVMDYYTKQLANTSDFHRSEVLDYVVSKFGRFVTDPQMRAVFDQPRSTLDFDALLAAPSTLIVDLNIARNGRDSAVFLGWLILTSLLTAAMRRGSDASAPGSHRPIYLYVDEAQFFVGPLGSIAAEGRKYGLFVSSVATQHISQLARSGAREALLGNLGNFQCYRIGQPDSHLMAEVLGLDPEAAGLLTSLPAYHAVVRLIARGEVQAPFVIKAEPPVKGWSAARVRELRELSRAKYGVEYKGGRRSYESDGGSRRERDRKTSG